jgi:PAS domain S-box-containing protein
VNTGDFRIELANPPALTLFGLSDHEILNKQITRAIPGLSSKAFTSLLKDHVNNVDSSPASTVIQFSPAGNEQKLSLRLTVQQLVLEDNIPAGLMVYAHDVTELSSARKQLREREERLQYIMEATGLGNWEFSLADGTLHWSAACRKIFGVAIDEEISFEKYRQLLHPEDLDYVLQVVGKAQSPDGDGQYSISHRIVRGNDGAVRWVHSLGSVQFENGSAIKLLGTVADITTQKEAEVKLKENEQRMRLAIRATGLGTYEWDIVNQNFIFSDGLARMFGFTDAAGLTQNSFAERIHPDDAKMRLHAHEEAWRKGVLFYEARFIWPDGTLHWIRVNGNVVFDENGSPAKLYGTTLDITDQKRNREILEQQVELRTRELRRLNEALRNSEERYHLMIEQVVDYAIIMLDVDGNILNWNRGAEKIKGYTEKEIVGQNFRKFYTEEDRKKKLPETFIGAARKTGKAMHEGWRVRKDGTKFWGSIVMTALRDDKKKIIGFSKVTRDLTEKKLAEDKLRQYTIELEFQNKELEQFAYIASHDLQEPLRKIQTFTEIITNNIDNKEFVLKYFDKINTSARRMADLIKSVLNYSRLSTHESDVAPVDLNKLMTEVLNDFELLIAEKNAKISVAELPTVRGIGLQLLQLFSNLVSNALKFNTGAPEITISSKKMKAAELKDIGGLKPEETYVLISLADNGIGFEQKYSEHVFTIFQRLHKNQFPGTGIGLALCKRIVENHKGRIWVESHPGKGSTFFMLLPLA